ncbi:hypothetical protein ACEN2L_14335 [Flavobacterium sp. W21_SRS_FM6]
MRQFRITKYNPKNRDNSGAYLLDEWTEFSDVGSLTSIEEYEAVESKYIECLKLLLEENQISTLRIIGLEDNQNLCPFKDNEYVSASDFGKLFRSVLRSEVWCKLEIQNAFVHFGYDYYSYIGVSSVSQDTINKITQKGLYIENFNSPYTNIGT